MDENGQKCLKMDVKGKHWYIYKWIYIKWTTQEFLTNQYTYVGEFKQKWTKEVLRQARAQLSSGN